MISKFRCPVAAAMLAWALQAQAAMVSYEWSSGFNNGGIIPDGDFSGWSDLRTVSTSASDIQSVVVTLNVAGEFNGDLYAYLSYGSGFAVLLNRPGRTAGNAFGYDDAGFVISLSDQAGTTTDIHSYGGNSGAPLTGTFQSDGRNVDPSAVLDTDPRDARLTSFDGLDANGTWTLFCADLSAGGESKLVSWGLEIETVPEPTTAALVIFSGVVCFSGVVSSMRRKRNRAGRRDMRSIDPIAQ